ncbi:MAG: hypothetical protein WCT03_06210 [Candidatus Obscuribacterales bacterium]|jgi:hypothetical protein
MAQSGISSSSDAVESAPSSRETSSHVFQEASFQAPGDSSPNDMWRQMKQGDAGMNSGASGSGSNNLSSDFGKQGNTSDGSIDFSAHSDIYGSAGSSSGAASGDTRRADIAAAEGRKQDPGLDSANLYSSGQLAGSDSGKQDAGLESALPAGNDKSPSGFERLSADDQINAPVERLNQAVDQNHQNLLSRIDSLGDDMPRVAFHGATPERAQAIDSYYASAFGDAQQGESGKGGSAETAGNVDGNGDRSIFVATAKTTSSDANGKLADMANSHQKADSYRGSDQPAYAFDVSHKQDKDFMTKRLQDTQSSVGEPFASATNSYEAQMGLSDLKPLAKIAPADASRVQPDHTAADYLDRIKALEALYRQSAIDSVVSAVEKKNQ